MAQTQVILGDFTFADFEVPESLRFGGEQALTIHKLVGGARVVDAMGADDMPLEWSGLFMGSAALERAQYLDTQRALGQSLTLTWSQFRYQVVIRSFEGDYRKINHIPYRITCEVVQNQTAPVNTIVQSDIDDQMDGDFASASAYGGLIGDGPLSSLLSGLGSAVGAVSSFANGSSSLIGSVLQPIAAVQSRVSLLLASSINAGQNITSVGGVMPNLPATQVLSSLASQSVSFGQQPALFGLQSVLGRMTANLGSVSGNSSTVATAGGNLFQLAAQNYGDATSWTAIAKANGLTDPMLTGVQNIVVPKLADTAGGLLGV